ncbi:MAG: dTDP-glucose 4,6-dehydratase [Ignavibacteria bacterium]|nr:dTDP-glucose 4,6-dehydratase [Ignavibacteria bacterium]
MKVMVTGGAGFIGSNLVRYLLNNTAMDIVIVDSLTYAGNLESISDCLKSDRVSFNHVDISDKIAVDFLFTSTNFVGVFHLAAESHVDRSIVDSSPFYNTNVIGTLNLLDNVVKHNTPRFVHVSTDEVYGSLTTGEAPFTETNLLLPSSPYAASKAASDLLVRSYVVTHGADCVITRCSNNYGPYQFPEKLIPLMILNAFEGRELPVYGDGQQVRDWIHVEDHCAGLLAAFSLGKAGEVYNLGGITELQNMEVVRSIVTLTGASDELITRVTDRKGHDRRYAMDISKATTQLNWRPIVGFAVGLKNTVDWYSANKEWTNHVRTGEYKLFYEKNYNAKFKE